LTVLYSPSLGYVSSHSMNGEIKRNVSPWARQLQTSVLNSVA